MKKISTYCMAATLAITSAIAVSSMVSSTATSQPVELSEVRHYTPFVVITSLGSNSGTAKIGLDDYTITVGFEYLEETITDRVSGLSDTTIEVYSLHDIVVRNLNGEKVYDFTENQDHQQFAAMIRHKLMEY